MIQTKLVEQHETADSAHVLYVLQFHSSGRHSKTIFIHYTFIGDENNALWRNRTIAVC